MSNETVREQIATMLIPYMRDSERYAISDAIIEIFKGVVPVEAKPVFDNKELTESEYAAKATAELNYAQGFNFCKQVILSRLGE